MKKIFFTIVLSLICSCSIIFISCDDLLETKNFTDMAPSNFFGSEGDFDAAVTGIYLPLTTNWGYGDGGTGGWYNALFNADGSAYYPASMRTTDAMRSYWTGEDYTDFNVGPSSGGALTNTYNIIRFVARATDVIDQIGKSNTSTEDTRNRYIAETKILRAFYMYTLLDWFGPVNVKLDPAKLMDNTIEPRPSNDDYIGYILTDLDDAIKTTSLPDKYNGDAGNWGRMSKTIAYGIRMKLYMHEKNWTNAKADAEKLMTMGYSLLPDYEDVFNTEQNEEQIWSIPSNTAYDNFYITEVLPSDFKRGYNHLGAPYIRGNENTYKNGWANYCMRWEFYDTFEDHDVRKATILCEYDAGSGNRVTRSTMTGAIPLKFTDTQFDHYGIQKAHPVIRYAEVLLSYAEAENELNGPTTSAVNAVKQITERAKTEIPASATAGKDAFRDYILAERGRELYCEGQRRQDLIRHGKYISRARERGVNAKDHQVLFPIPQFAVTEAGGILKQNDGYTE